jgi:hypothetical protein
MFSYFHFLAIIINIIINDQPNRIIVYSSFKKTTSLVEFSDSIDFLM